MDLRIFEKTPAIAPLLVRLYETHKLYGLAQERRPEAQSELTTAVADLLTVDLTINEQELLTEVLIALMRQAERDLRRALSEKLCAMDTVPLRVVLHLANDDAFVAAPVLKASPVLSDLDLIYVVKAQGPEYWRIIAARESLGEGVINALADTGDPGTAVILSENQRITLTKYAATILARMAVDFEEVAVPLIARPDLPPGVVRDLYKHAGAELRIRIRALHSSIDDGIEQAFNGMMIEFTERQPDSEFMPTEPMIKSAENIARLGMLNLHTMIDALQKGSIPNFIALFAQYTGVPAQRVHDFLRQRCPKGMAIACRAFGVQKSDFSRIYLTTHRMRSKARIVNHKDMLEVLAYFDKIRPEVAQRIIERR